MKLYMFRTVPLSITRSFSLYTQQWYMSYRFADSLRATLERLSIYVNVVLLVSPNTDIPAPENEFIFKYHYVFLYSFYGMTCLYQWTL